MERIPGHATERDERERVLVLPPHLYTRPVQFQQPAHLTSFSYSPTRQLLLGDRRDESLSYYSKPPQHADLNRGFEQCVWRDESVDEGLDSLLATLQEYAENDATGEASNVVARASICTWRGMVSKLMLAVYEAEAVSQNKRADSWEMNAMIIDGTLYLEEAKSPSKIAQKSASEENFKLQSYYGYSFESYCTRPSPSVPAEFHPPNTNVQWCSVVKTSLGGFRMLLGGEVDCILPSNKPGKSISTADFIELKTNIEISNAHGEMMFERQKLLKHYTQSFLLGVPAIIVGFRTRPGFVDAVQTFRTLEIPRLVRGKPHGWDPSISLASAHDLLTFVHSRIASHPATKNSQAEFDAASSETPIESFTNWPVFRVAFVPNGRAEVSVRLIGESEMEGDVIGGKFPMTRVGMLPVTWVKGVRERRRQSEKIANLSGGARVGGLATATHAAPLHR